MIRKILYVLLRILEISISLVFKVISLCLIFCVLPIILICASYEMCVMERRFEKKEQQR
jgi:Na+-transporting methylmalonyl-CoA/oxaloacetate decarboxylase gamma subunit